MNNYQWKIKSFGKGVDPELVVSELEKIQNTLQEITPQNIVEAAKRKKSVLHDLFTWDDTVAAHNYRLHQARRMINNIEVIISADGEEKQIDVFEIINTDEGRTYKHINNLTVSDIRQISDRILLDLSRLRLKYKTYKEFSKISDYIDLAINSLSK